jgi:hypothetical protein
LNQRSSLLRNFLKYSCKSIYKIGSCAQCYKTFYIRNLQIIVISQSVYPWQAFQLSLMFVGKTGA